MTDVLNPAPEAGNEVVQPEAKQAEAAEAPDSTEGQVEGQPADAEEAAKAEAEAAERSKSALRRDRRKAEDAKRHEREMAAIRQAQEAEAQVQSYKAAAQNIPAPKQSDFADFEQYQAALSAFSTMRMLDARKVQEMEAAAKEAFTERQKIETEQRHAADQSLAALVEEGQRKFADFDAVAKNDNVHITRDMALIMADSDVGADLAYHLGKNPELAAKLAAMQPRQMAFALGNLEAQLSAPKPQTVTSAPPPISPVRPKATATADAENMSYEDYRTARRAGKLR